MRTTVVLDPDLDARVRAIARERGITFREALNILIRAGLGNEITPKPYRQRARAMKLRPRVDLDKALQLASDVEDEETIRKLRLRK